MEIIKKRLEGFFEITPNVHEDFRGCLIKFYDREAFHRAGLAADFMGNKFVQHSNKKDTIRGLHIQLPPYTETKLIYPFHGKIKWIVADMRKDSETFGQWDFIELDAELRNSSYVSAGFANGAISLVNNSAVFIQTDKPYIEEYGIGINWRDTDLNIDWNLNGRKPVILERDDYYPSFADFKKKYGGI